VVLPNPPFKELMYPEDRVLGTQVWESKTHPSPNASHLWHDP
jgi:hypothetical protein